jgi:hypothetical protein
VAAAEADGLSPGDADADGEADPDADAAGDSVDVADDEGDVDAVGCASPPVCPDPEHPASKVTMVALATRGSPIRRKTIMLEEPFALRTRIDRGKSQCHDGRPGMTTTAHHLAV